MATLDKRTSNVCQGLDGSKHKYKDRQSGTNFPPMHPMCRSTHYDDIPNSMYGNRASRNKDGKSVHEVPAKVTYKQWQKWQTTGKKPWEVKPKAKPRPKMTKEKETELVQSIMDKHAGLFPKTLMGELKGIVSTWDSKTKVFYDNLASHFKNNDYMKNAKTAGAYYMPSEKKVTMGIKKNSWETSMGLSRNGAWNTKIHEEFHQLDHLMGNTPLAHGSNGAVQYVTKLTDPQTKVGAKMIQSIDKDLVNFANESIDVANKTRSTQLKHITYLADLGADEVDAFMVYLGDKYPTIQDRSRIGLFTDAMGLSTSDKLSPYKNSFWGHKTAYNVDRGKTGATSEAWATYGATILQDNAETLMEMHHIMPNTMKTFGEVFEQVTEYAQNNKLEY